MINPITNFQTNNNILHFKSQNNLLNETNRTIKQLNENGYGRKDIDDYYKFLYGEIEEFKDGVKNNDKANMEEELGDVLFDTIMLGNYYGIDTQKALLRTNKKIQSRLFVAQQIADKPLIEYPLQTRLEYWEQAKQILKETDK